MSDLDEKLKNILHIVIPREGEIEGMTNELHERCIEVTVDKIHQAFEDEGYVYIPQVEVVTRYEAGKKPEVFMVNGQEVMTGQDWYDRFEAIALKDRNLNWHHILEAAKKASGIKEEQQNA